VIQQSVSFAQKMFTIVATIRSISAMKAIEPTLVRSTSVSAPQRASAPNMPPAIRNAVKIDCVV
jgi:hypothetical protein